MRGLGYWFAMVCVLAVSRLQGLAHKIDRVKSARTRIMGYGIRVCVHAVTNLLGLAHKVDRVQHARSGIVQGSSD